MSDYKDILYSVRSGVARLTLNRPEVHNALGTRTVQEVRDCIERVARDPGVRLLLIAGEGRSFCAGADIQAMREACDAGWEDNRREAADIGQLFHLLHRLPRPVVARVHGAARGGGSGLVCASDIVIASERASFAFTEVRLGIVPAVISPYVLRRIGEGAARFLFLTGRRVDAHTALRLGLVDRVVAPDALDEAVGETVGELIRGAPGALASCKELVSRVASLTPEEALRVTPEILAEMRNQDEAREGLEAFLEKKSPAWVMPSPSKEDGGI